MEQDEQNETQTDQALTVPAQPPLFFGAPETTAKMPRYTYDQIALALKRTRGEKLEASRLLGCSHTTIDKRCSAQTREGQKLRDLVENLKMTLVGSSLKVIHRAIDDRCWECAGRKVVKLVPRFVGDPEEADCPVCFGTGYHGGKKEPIDPVERRQWAWRILQTLGRRMGFGDRVDVVKIDASWFDGLEDDQVESALDQLKSGVPLEDVYQSIRPRRSL